MRAPAPFIVAAALLVSACGSKGPDEPAQSPQKTSVAPTLRAFELLADPERYIGQRVRLTGQVGEVFPGRTALEIGPGAQDVVVLPSDDSRVLGRALEGETVTAIGTVEWADEHLSDRDLFVYEQPGSETKRLLVDFSGEPVVLATEIRDRASAATP